MNRFAVLVGGILLGAALAVPLAVYETGGASLINTAPSPDGQERVEFYTPTRWQALTAPRYDMPAWVRLVRIRNSAPLGDSALFDLSGEGQAIWSSNIVQIGSSASYNRTTRRWTIIQE